MKRTRACFPLIFLVLAVTSVAGGRVEVTIPELKHYDILLVEYSR